MNEPEKLEYMIKVVGGFYVDQPIDTTKSVMTGIELDVYSAEKRDLQEDNRYLIVYKGKVIGLPLVSQGEKKFKTFSKSKKSQVFRWMIQSYGEEYESTMQKLLDHEEEVIEFIRGLE